MRNLNILKENTLNYVQVNLYNKLIVIQLMTGLIWNRISLLKIMKHGPTSTSYFILYFLVFEVGSVFFFASY